MTGAGALARREVGEGVEGEGVGGGVGSETCVAGSGPGGVGCSCEGCFAFADPRLAADARTVLRLPGPAAGAGAAAALASGVLQLLCCAATDAWHGGTAHGTVVVLRPGPDPADWVVWARPAAETTGPGAGDSEAPREDACEHAALAWRGTQRSGCVCEVNWISPCGASQRQRLAGLAQEVEVGTNAGEPAKLRDWLLFLDRQPMLVANMLGNGENGRRASQAVISPQGLSSLPSAPCSYCQVLGYEINRVHTWQCFYYCVLACL